MKGNGMGQELEGKERERKRGGIVGKGRKGGGLWEGKKGKGGWREKVRDGKRERRNHIICH